MRLRAFLSRLALTTAASGLALNGLALPAQAADEQDFAYVAILAPETVTVINGQAKTVKFDLYNISDTKTNNVALNFGTAAQPIRADLGFAAPADCAGNTCQLGSLKPGERRSVKFTLKPAAGGTTAPAGTIALSTSVAGTTSDETSIAVVRTDKGGVDLEMGDIADLKLSPGKSANVPVVVANSGNKDVKALGLVVLSPFGLTPALAYRNCEKATEEGITAIVCVFNDTLAAGGSFTLPSATPLRVKVPGNAAGPYDYPIYVGVVGLSDKYVFDFTKRTAGAAGAELKMETIASTTAEEPEPVDDLNEDDNYTLFSVSVPKTSADSAAVGGTFTGAIGTKASVEVGMRNRGPASTVPPAVTWIQYVHVKLPTGVELTKSDDRCLPGTSFDDIDESVRDLSEVTDLVCLVLESVPADKKHLFTLTAEILDAAEHKAGTVTVDGGVQDSKTGNNKAALTVKLTAAGGGGGLPITGAPAGLIAVGGAVLLLAGAIAFRAARRRRIITVVE
ncbi:hypothetical protein SAMN04489716_6470 [Actinoplanes derwentensis]|uniref:LPXTG-motif cell wall anchor domain-containing protein n=2 Tax=Actinoplanes derwentensis TaxID=113562 RepID=A0A1H2CQI3_9ACTN|nr:hypothetical protein Ade03nite_27430 [Actinoplanes derwentensis]SDT72691.1 hypothetical protein SAMN04489716_6470 [Actinoplanes derwentensis]